MDSFIIGVAVGYFSGLTTIVLAVVAAGYIAEKRLKEPTREEWKLR